MRECKGYLHQVKGLQSKFDSFDLLHVPRSGNAHADSLAMLATSSAQDLPQVILVEDLYKLSRTGEMVQIDQIKAGPSWMDSIIRFLKEDILPEEKIVADKIRRRLLVIGYQRTINYISVPFQDLICYVSTPR